MQIISVNACIVNYRYRVCNAATDELLHHDKRRARQQSPRSKCYKTFNGKVAVFINRQQRTTIFINIAAYEEKINKQIIQPNVYIHMDNTNKNGICMTNIHVLIIIIIYISIYCTYVQKYGRTCIIYH